MRHVRELTRQYDLQTASSQSIDSPESTELSEPDPEPEKTRYIIDNEGPTPANSASPELVELFSEFMLVDKEDE